MPVATPTADGFLKGIFKTPCIPNSNLPALLGLQSLYDSRGIIDCNDGHLYFCGPGNYDLMQSLPAGTKVIQCQYAPSGHLMMPVDAYQALDREEKNGGLTIEKEIVLPTQVSSSSNERPRSESPLPSE